MIFGWGMPISTTLASVGSIIGVGVSKDRDTVSSRIILKIIGAWVFTVPCAAVICGAIYTILKGVL